MSKLRANVYIHSKVFNREAVVSVKGHRMHFLMKGQKDYGKQEHCYDVFCAQENSYQHRGKRRYTFIILDHNTFKERISNPCKRCLTLAGIEYWYE